MKNSKIITPEDYVVMPWKNGLGTTVELIKQNLPNQAGFCWRLSMADVSNDGPFSHFPGYDRTLVLLEGNGMDLEFDNTESVELTAPLQMATFKGDADTIATLHNGPIKDFNIMTARSHCKADVTTSTSNASVDSGSGPTLNINCDALFIYAVDGELNITDDLGEPTSIPNGHLLYLKNPKTEKITLNQNNPPQYIACQITYV